MTCLTGVIAQGGSAGWAGVTLDVESVQRLANIKSYTGCTAGVRKLLGSAISVSFLRNDNSFTVITVDKACLEQAFSVEGQVLDRETLLQMIQGVKDLFLPTQPKDYQIRVEQETKSRRAQEKMAHAAERRKSSMGPSEYELEAVKMLFTELQEQPHLEVGHLVAALAKAKELPWVGRLINFMRTALEKCLDEIEAGALLYGEAVSRFRTLVVGKVKKEVIALSTRERDIAAELKILREDRAHLLKAWNRCLRVPYPENFDLMEQMQRHRLQTSASNPEKRSSVSSQPFKIDKVSNMYKITALLADRRAQEKQLVASRKSAKDYPGDAYCSDMAKLWNMLAIPEVAATFLELFKQTAEGTYQAAPLVTREVAGIQLRKKNR